MPDRIPQLDDLASAAKESPMLSPSEIRRLGDRRRTTRQATGAVAAVLALTVGGVAAWNSPLSDSIRGPQWAQAPGPTTPTTQAPLNPMTTPSVSPDPAPPTSTVDPPTWANVPTAEMLREDHPDALLEQKDEYEGPGQAAKGYCDPGADAWGEPSTFLVREFGNPDDGYGTYLWATVLGYPSVELAEQSFAALRDGIARCPDRIVEIGTYPDPVGYDPTEELPLDPTWTDGQTTDHAFLQSSGMNPPGKDDGIFIDSLIVRAGERVLWVTADIIGPDHNCSIAPDDPDVPEQCQIPAAVQEMVETLVK